MGFFNLFKQKPKPFPYKDITWMKKSARWKGCKEMLASNPDWVLIAWFPDTLKEALSALGDSVNVELARTVTDSSVQGKSILMLEHFPTFSKEQDWITHANPKEVVFLNTLEDAIFLYFGGKKLLPLLEKLGMGEEESLEHRTISASIRRAQEKIEESLVVERSASSQEDWIRKNASAIMTND